MDLSALAIHIENYSVTFFEIIFLHNRLVELLGSDLKSVVFFKDLVH